MKEEVGMQTFCLPRNHANMLTMAFAYFGLFTAFNTTQMMVSKILGDLGSFSLALVYGFFAITGFLAPAVNERFKPRMTMFMGAVTYALYVASVIYIITPLLLFTSALMGFGAAILWTGQGAFLTQNTTPENRGFLGGMFWGIFQLSNLPGNIAAHFLLNHPGTPPKGLHWVLGWSDSFSVLFVCLACAGGLGCCLFLLLRDPDPKTGTVLEEKESPPVMAQVKATFTLMLEPRMRLLLPAMTWTGLELTFYAGWMTRQMYPKTIGIVMCGFGLAEFFAGLGIGKLLDKMGRYFVVVFVCLTCTLGLVMAWVGNDVVQDACAKRGKKQGCDLEFGKYTPFFVAAVMFGFMDCATQTLMAQILSGEYKQQAPEAFAIFRTLQAVAAMTGFFVSPLLGGADGSTKGQYAAEVAIMGSMAAISWVCVVIFLRKGGSGRDPEEVLAINATPSDSGCEA